jgi:DNA (cytosine-5)-methyltransferase 1
MRKKLTTISLYTGAGGLDYGFEAAGFRTVVAVEMDERCIDTIRANRRWPVISADISDVPTVDILAKGKPKPGEADVLIGGPPCQPFSKSGFWATGSTKRLTDPRASTLENYLRVLDESRPAAFLLVVCHIRSRMWINRSARTDYSLAILRKPKLRFLSGFVAK